VEAWPEGNQRHLAAESALNCRTFTEGLFGMRPTGLRSFALTLRFPPPWNDMSLKNVRAFGETFHIEVTRNAANLLSGRDAGRKQTRLRINRAGRDAKHFSGR
jgi:hypothetical protein